MSRSDADSDDSDDNDDDDDVSDDVDSDDDDSDNHDVDDNSNDIRSNGTNEKSELLMANWHDHILANYFPHNQQITQPGFKICNVFWYN